MNRTATFKREFGARGDTALPQSPQDSLALAREVIEQCHALACFSEDIGSLRRTYLCPALRDCHLAISGWAASVGITSRVDAAGNLRILCPAANPDAGRVLMGSHLDTVPNAGMYDGMLGVVLPIAVLKARRGRPLPFAVEIVGFSEEEGVRFGTPFIGSRALVGRLDEDLLRCRDANGISVREAISNFGLNPAELTQAVIAKNTLAYIEFHIEQGPVLENVGQPLGVVEAIAGQSRLELVFEGHANHAGTTPMNLRYDSLAGAAEWITAVERRARDTSGLVATVGAIEARPGAGNVIAAETRLSLDVRHQNDATRLSAVDDLMCLAQKLVNGRQLRLRSKVLMDQRAVEMDPVLIDVAERAARTAGCEPHRMASGAGHDAMIMAERVPSSMVFLRTPGGISHDPAESVGVDDVARAIDCGFHLLEQLSESPGELWNRV